MIGYSAIEAFSPQLVAIHRVATALVERLPDRVDGDYLRCHELARLVHDCIRPYLGSKARLRVVDGKYRRQVTALEPRIDHSWLVVERDCSLDTILDVYAIARLPMVVLAEISLAYEPGPLRTDIDTDIIGALFRTYGITVQPDATLRDALAGIDPCEPREIASTAVVREAVTTGPDETKVTKATRQRAVKHIAVAQDHETSPTLVALADDGTLWSKRNGFDSAEWKEIPGLPPGDPIKRAPPPKVPSY